MAVIDKGTLSRTVQHITRYNGEKRTYYAYPEQEAQKLGIDYLYWKDVKYQPIRNTLFYVLSDDKVVIPVWDVTFTNVFIILRTPFGNFALPKFKSKDAKMVVLPENKAYEEDSLKKKCSSHAYLKQVIASFASRGLSKEEILDSLCANPTQRGTRQDFIKKFLTTQECKTMVRDEVRDMMNAVGLTEQKVLQYLLDAHKMAVSKQDVSNTLRSVETMIDLFGLKDRKKETTTQTMELESSHEDLERLERVQERVKLEQKESLEIG